MKLIRSGLVLLIVSMVAALLLGFTNEVTKGKIEEQRRMAREMAMKNVQPEAVEFSEISFKKDPASKVGAAHVAKDSEGNIIGVIFFTYPNGFGGKIEVIVGIGIDGVMSGLRIGFHSETPGFGAEATKEDFYGQFKGKNALEPMVVVKKETTDNNIESISGATITSKAILSGVQDAIQLYTSMKEKGGAL